MVYAFLSTGDIKTCSLVCSAWNSIAVAALFEHMVVPGKLAPTSTMMFLGSSRRLVQHVKSLVVCGAVTDISGPLLVQAVLLISGARNLSFISMDRVRFEGKEWFQMADLDPLKCVRLGLQKCNWTSAELRFLLAVSSNVREMVISDEVVFPDVSVFHLERLRTWTKRLGGDWGERSRCSPTSITINGRRINAFWSLFGSGLSVPVCLRNVRELVLLGLPEDDVQTSSVVNLCSMSMIVLKCILPGEFLTVLGMLVSLTSKGPGIDLNQAYNMMRCELVVTHASMEALMFTVTSLEASMFLKELTIAISLDNLSWEWMNDITWAALQVPMLTRLIWKLWSDGSWNLVKRRSLQKLLHSRYPIETVVICW